MVSVEIEILVDDENWGKKLTLSAFWLDEMISVLRQAKEKIDGMDLDEWKRRPDKVAKQLLNARYPSG